MTTITSLQKEIDQIKKRNKSVELDKKWETSFTRRILLIMFTYVTIGLYLQSIKIENSWMNAVVPAVGFYLSTLTLPFFKGLWEKKYRE
ncbi:hypothetical protein COY16_04560 [Candidatus Roizmanbacteria bacterium CG_4_10_14_0_2_um_filter_39_13]|uniref:Uncharacterized protein n=1 Tax=Candidatus Roizmanbacteria bacterium CG_4_10_14_0_2_um_filter_39_13 TaxID=1974825 RepID=A0A2M7TX32_9BACT|nr:MAG: hypothetical protein COY16_04560 [Candidatus Roizmanbacteria bacterium CG_4_10_14_0_2_um_filter_39_13]